MVFGDLALRPEAQKLVDEYSSNKHGAKAIFQKTDVSSWDDLTALFKAAEKEFRTYDIVCPGAGIFEPPFSGFWNPPGSENSKDDVSGGRYKSIDVNIVHPIRSTQMAISHFLSSASKDSPKTVVHIASIASEISFSPVAIYCATKWAIRGFIYSMADLEESHNIRVAGVAPGIVRTPLWLDHQDKRDKIFTKEGTEQDDCEYSSSRVALCVRTKSCVQGLRQKKSLVSCLKFVRKVRLRTRTGIKYPLKVEA